MGGEIWVESEFGSGSTFTFTLNAAPVKNEEQHHAINEEIADQTASFPLRILLAEDNVIHQKVILKQLKKLNLTAEVVNDGQQVIDLINQKIFDVVLLDTMMPLLDGIETAKAIAKHGSLNHPPTLIGLRSNDDGISKEDCLKAGMDACLPKPFKIEELDTVIKSIFQQKENLLQS